MDSLIKLAEKIKDKELRIKTISLLKDPKLSNKAMDYKPLKIRESPGGYPGFEHHMVKGGLVKHTEGVVELATKIAGIVEKRYGPVNEDLVLAGAILHDIMRVYDFTKEGDEYSLTPKLLEHEQLIGCELYARGFPEEVVAIVLNHLKPEGFVLELGLSKTHVNATPVKQSGLGMSLEGFIVHYADTIDAYSDYYFRELLTHALEGALSEEK